MPIAAILALLQLVGVVLRPDTLELIERSFASAYNIIKSIIANKKEPTPEEVEAMIAALKAGEDKWDQILSDWK